MNIDSPYCQKLAELIAACDSTDPDPELVARIDEHLEQCKTCAQAESALNETVAAYRSAEFREISAEFESDLVNRLCHKAPEDNGARD